MQRLKAALTIGFVVAMTIVLGCAQLNSNQGVGQDAGGTGTGMNSDTDTDGNSDTDTDTDTDSDADTDKDTGFECPPAPTEFPNPIIKYDAEDPTNGPGDYIYTADAAAMVWNNTVYLYTGHDEQVEGGSGYRMFDWLLYASTDMVHWENKGAVIRYDAFPWARGGETGNANAAHAVHRDDENGDPKFYFYAPVEGGQSEWGISIGVAVADSPEGPFEDARGIPLIYLNDTNGLGGATHTWRNLDPAVFVDDDGRVYMYWGNNVLYWVELEEDMIHIKGETYTTDNNGTMLSRTISNGTINFSTTLTNYTEAPWLTKRGDLYYLSYASNFPETTSYATSSSPLGPWEYRGEIVGRVPNSDTVHQSIFDFCGASYITYHNGALPTGGPYRRSTCIDRLYYNDDGTIQTVVQTSK